MNKQQRFEQRLARRRAIKAAPEKLRDAAARIGSLALSNDQAVPGELRRDEALAGDLRQLADDIEG